MKTILITGTTSGIGTVTATELARQGHRVIMANRNRQKSEALRSDIVSETNNENVDLIDLDLASMTSVQQCAEQFLSQHGKLDLLINNAGLMSNDEVITEDGFELQIAVNALAQFRLTLALVPALEAAAPSQVIFVTSMMHKFGKLNPHSFRGWDKYSGGGSYGQSKLAMTMLAKELAERLSERNIAVNSLHPGAVNTGILDNYSAFSQFFLRLLFVSPQKGARTTLHLAGLDPSSTPTGEYFTNCKPASSHKLVSDSTARSQLWDTCIDLLGVSAAP